MFIPSLPRFVVVLTFNQRFTPQFLLMRLKHATTAQDEASETVASTFVQASPPDTAASIGKDVDDFVKEFREMRKVYHKRAIWGDRWSAGQVASTVTCVFCPPSSDPSSELY